MRKNDKDITEADKQEAKRRIQGSVAMGDSPMDSDDEGRGNKRSSLPPTMNTMAASSL
jgi:phosphatidylserine decarboxylase